MEDWIIRLVEWAGYWGVAALMLLETVFPPVPSEVIMTVAGVSAARGTMTLEGTILAGTAGAMLGNWFWYWLAIKFGEARMHVFIDKYSRWLTLDWDEVERGERLFAKYGSSIVLIARMIPTLRSLISIPAGCSRCRCGAFWSSRPLGPWAGARPWPGRAISWDRSSAKSSSGWGRFRLP